MKKTTLKITALLLALLMMISLALVSCDKPLDDDGNNGQNGNPYVGIMDNPWPDLGGATINFAVAETTDNDGLNERSIEVSADTGDRVDAAIYKRNKNIEARFNCKINLELVVNDNIAETKIFNTVFSKDSDYDIIAGRQYDDIELCTVGDGPLVNLVENEYAKKYIDLTKPWWATEYIKGMAYNKKAYWLAGDLNLGYTGGFYATFVNATIYDDNFKSDPSYGDIYQIVKDGRWTVDMMRQLSDLATTATSGDPISGPMAGQLLEGEVIGVAFPIRDNANALAVSCGVEFARTNKDGTVSLAFQINNPTLINFYNEYRDLLRTAGCVNYYGASENGGYRAAFEDFAANKVLFVPGRIDHSDKYLKNMNGDFYVIPNAKLTENQKNYISTVSDTISIYGINEASENIEASVIVLEAMAAESYRTVVPVYYDAVLKGKYTTDVGTREMIDLIRENSYFDFVLAWANTSYFQGGIGGVLGNFLAVELRNEADAISTDLIVGASSWYNAIPQIDSKFNDNED